MKYHLGKPKKRVSSQFRISDHFSFQCGKLDLFTSASLYLFYISLETTLSRKGGEKRFCETIPQLVHTLQAGLPCFFRPQTLGPKFNAPWVQSKVTSWNTPVIRAELAKKSDDQIRRQPKCTKSLFHIFCFHCLGEIRVLISGSSEGSSLIFVTCLCRGQVTIPWLKWLTDALASEPILQIWPRGFSVKPGRVRWRPWKIIMAREDSWMYLLSISFGSKCHSLAKVWDPWLTLLSLAWKPHYCWLCNQLFIIKSNLM